MKTLNNLSHLRDSGFGQPPPRHGLCLLWWFGRKCVRISEDGRMIALCNPADGDFGFRRFNNDDGRLPDSDLLYYELGNLSTPGLLPYYVTKNYESDFEESNADRIIVSVSSDEDGEVCFEKIYVTQLDMNHTYRISQGLIQVIKNTARTDFLESTLLFFPLLLSCGRYYYRQTEKESIKESNKKNIKVSIGLISCALICIGIAIVVTNWKWQ